MLSRSLEGFVHLVSRRQCLKLNPLQVSSGARAIVQQCSSIVIKSDRSFSVGLNLPIGNRPDSKVVSGVCHVYDDIAKWNVNLTSACQSNLLPDGLSPRPGGRWRRKSCHLPMQLQLHPSLSVCTTVRTKFSPDDGACEITLNRPDKLNTLNLNMSPGMKSWSALTI